MNLDTIINGLLAVIGVLLISLCCFTSYNDEQIHKVCMNSVNYSRGDLVQIKGSNKKLIVQYSNCYGRNDKPTYRVLNELGDTNEVHDSNLERYVETK